MGLAGDLSCLLSTCSSSFPFLFFPTLSYKLRHAQKGHRTRGHPVAPSADR